MATQRLAWTASATGPTGADVLPGATDPVAADDQPIPALLDHSARRRAIRVVCLTFAMVLMSLADLQITMMYLRTVGMGEGNPVARFVMGHGSPALLVVWKCASVSLTALVFVRYRDRRFTEGACWFACLVLVWLLMQWTTYAEEAWRLTPALHSMPDTDSALWVRMAGEP